MPSPIPPRPGWVELLAKGAGRLASMFLRLGKSLAEVISAILASFPGSTRSSAQAVAIRTQQALAAGAELNQSPLTGGIPAGSIPVDPNLPQPFRYTVIIDFIDPTTGQRAWRTVVIDSAEALTREYAARQGFNIWNAMINEKEQYRQLQGDVTARNPTITIVEVWRGTLE